MADYVARKNEKLVEAMHAVRTSESGNRDAEKIMLEELSERAVFYMPVKITGSTARDRKLTFGVTQDRQGHHYYMLFTDKDKLRVWADGAHVQMITHSFGEASDIAYGDPRIFGFVINPRTDDMIIGRQMISDVRAMLHGQERGMEPERQNQDDSIEFRSVRQDKTTEELISFISGYMHRDRNVAAAYIRDMVRNGHLDYCIVIRHIGAMDETFTNVMNIAKQHSHGRSVALLSARAPIAEKAIEGVNPFYMKPFEMVD